MLSPAYFDPLDNPLYAALADAVLLPNRGSYRVNTAQVMYIGPGEPAQALHRDAGNWFQHMAATWPDTPEVTISAMIGLEEVTEELGASRAVPGSHRWRDIKVPDPGGGPSPRPHGGRVGGTLHPGPEAAGPTFLRPPPARWGRPVAPSCAADRGSGLNPALVDHTGFACPCGATVDPCTGDRHVREALGGYGERVGVQDRQVGQATRRE